MLERDGTWTVVQAKRWDDSVGIEAVYEVVGAKAHYGASEAVSRHEFTVYPRGGRIGKPQRRGPGRA